jgi:hypothetical protein
LQKAACDCRLAHEQQDTRDKTQFTTGDRAVGGASRDGAGSSSRVRSARSRR